jgi:hypothetical protein
MDDNIITIFAYDIFVTLNSAQAQRPSKFYKRCLSIALSIPGATKSISPHRHRLKNPLQA